MDFKELFPFGGGPCHPLTRGGITIPVFICVWLTAPMNNGWPCSNSLSAYLNATECWTGWPWITDLVGFSPSGTDRQAPPLSIVKSTNCCSIICIILSCNNICSRFQLIFSVVLFLKFHSDKPVRFYSWRLFCSFKQIIKISFSIINGYDMCIRMVTGQFCCFIIFHNPMTDFFFTDMFLCGQSLQISCRVFLLVFNSSLNHW